MLKFKLYDGSEIGENEMLPSAIPAPSNANVPVTLVGIRFISTINSFSMFRLKSSITSFVLLVSAETS